MHGIIMIHVQYMCFLCLLACMLHTSTYSFDDYIQKVPIYSVMVTIMWKMVIIAIPKYQDHYFHFRRLPLYIIIIIDTKLLLCMGTHIKYNL